MSSPQVPHAQNADADITVQHPSIRALDTVSRGAWHSTKACGSKPRACQSLPSPHACMGSCSSAARTELYAAARTSGLPCESTPLGQKQPYSYRQPSTPMRRPASHLSVYPVQCPICLCMARDISHCASYLLDQPLETTLVPRQISRFRGFCRVFSHLTELPGAVPT